MSTPATVNQVLDKYRKYLILCSPMEQAVDDTVDSADTVTEEVTIQLDRRTTVVPYRAGNTVLQTARMAGLQAPSSCESGSCATCMARLVEGSVRMINNDALTEEDIAEGWVLTCQSMPTSRSVRVVYE
ncbi:MAG: 2Fe-2S iron-sulfur cluster binding domain-containing protein [Mycobacterium sp.]|nr:2Fe-2S iron-sulfur cluster binding domain-containing protein [Mycobacterium sp.]